LCAWSREKAVSRRVSRPVAVHAEQFVLVEEVARTPLVAEEQPVASFGAGRAALVQERAERRDAGAGADHDDRRVPAGRRGEAVRGLHEHPHLLPRRARARRGTSRRRPCTGGRAVDEPDEADREVDFAGCAAGDEEIEYSRGRSGVSALVNRSNSGRAERKCVSRSSTSSPGSSPAPSASSASPFNAARSPASVATSAKQRPAARSTAA
jgi:hypothetical protein